MAGAWDRISMFLGERKIWEETYLHLKLLSPNGWRARVHYIGFKSRLHTPQSYRDKHLYQFQKDARCGTVRLTNHGKSKGLELLNPQHPIAMKLAMTGTHHKFGGCGD